MRLNADVIDVTIYQIEQLFGKEWNVIEPRAFDLGEDARWCGGSGREGAPIAYEFSACGECWQKTGEFGTFRLDLALRAMSALVQHGTKSKSLRLVKRHWQINTKVVVNIQVAS